MKPSENNSTNSSYLGKRMTAFRNAFRGLYFLFRSQANVRIHLIAAVIAIALGVWLKIGFSEAGVILFCIGSVFAAEAFNTSIEELTDLVSPQFDERAGRVKDLAAAAVLITSIASLACAVFIFGPRLWIKYQQFFHR